MLKPSAVSGYFRAVSQVVSNQSTVAGPAAILPKKTVAQVPFQPSTPLGLSKVLPNANFAVSTGPAVTTQVRLVTEIIA